MLAPTRLLLDTDIGTDVDDCLALALILKSPEIQLEGVTCVYGDVALRTRMVRKMLQLAGREDIPVCMGCRKPLLGIRPVYWAGHEGRGMLEAGDESLAPSQEHAADFIIRTVMANPGEIHLLAIGPLTNVALACLREPRLVENLAGLTVMAGAIRGRGAFDLPYAEHNVRSDPEAAHIVFASGARVRMVPLDVTMRVAIRRDGVERIRQGGTPLHELVARQVELYPHFAEHGFTYLHDPSRRHRSYVRSCWRSRPCTSTSSSPAATRRAQRLPSRERTTSSTPTWRWRWMPPPSRPSSWSA